MTIISYFLAIIKFIVYFFINNSIFSKIICCVLLLLLIYMLKTILKTPRNVSLLTYKIKNFVITIGFVVLYIFIFILILSIYRVSNIYREIDLKKILLDIYLYTKTTDIFIIIINISVVLLVFMVIWYLYKILKIKFIKEFTKLYIYLYQYDGFRDGVFYLCYTIINMPINNLYRFLKNKYNITCTYCRLFIENFGIIVLIFCFFYDIIFNNMLISKIYYIIPFAYIYMQVFLFKKFAESRHIVNDVSLGNYYYKKHIYKDQNGVYLENGDFYSTEDIQNLQEHILQDFKI